MLSHALAYSARGWPVLPVAPRDKRPLSAHGVKDATTDEATIRRWWTERPDANIGLACGEFVVVDVDDLAEWGDKTIDTYTVRTGSGKLHYYCSPGGNPKTRRLSKGIEVRGAGAYVVAPPSIHPSGGRYEVIADAPLADFPAWLTPAGNLAGLVDPTATPTAPRERPDALTRFRLYAENLDPAISGQGGHAATLRFACECFRFGLTESEAWGELCDYSARRCSPPWSEKELRHKLKEGRKLVDQAGAFGSKLEEGSDPDSLSPVTVESEPEPDEPADKFPVDLLNPPGVISELCRWINDTAYKPQPVLSLAASLAFWGAVVGRRVRTPTNLRTNLYCLGIAESGSGKDHARQQLKRVAYECGLFRELIGGEEVASDAAVMRVVGEFPATFFPLDEIGHFLSQANSKFAAAHMKNIAPTFTKLFTSAGSIYAGKEYGGRDRQDIWYPNVCLYGSTVPNRLYDGLTTGDVKDGFVGRLLCFFSDDEDPIERDDIEYLPVPESIKIAVKEWHGRWLKLPLANQMSPDQDRQPIMVEFDTEATSIIREFRRACREEKAKCRNGSGMDVLWSRCVEHASKVALVLATACEFELPTITASLADYAVRLVDFLTRRMISVVSENVTDTEHGRIVNRLRKIIRAGGRTGIAKRDVTRMTQELNSRQRDEAIRQLRETGEIEAIEQDTKTKGRKAVVYRSAKTI